MRGKMRRTDKEIKDRQQIDAIIKKANCCRIGLVDGIYPYIIPVNFAVNNNHLYFHSAKEGKKIDILRKTIKSILKWISKAKSLRGRKRVFGA